MSHPKVVSKGEYEVLAEFRYTLRQFMSFSENAAEEIGLTPQQHQALLAVKGFPGREQITVGELSERLQIKHHSAVGLIDRLEAENLIDRSEGSNDRRKVFYFSYRAWSFDFGETSTIHREELRRMAPQLRLLLKADYQNFRRRKLAL